MLCNLGCYAMSAYLQINFICHSEDPFDGRFLSRAA